MKSIVVRMIFCCFWLFNAEVRAVPFGVYDPNTLAMGGAGVATATASNASYYNPAMLAQYPVRKEKGLNSRFTVPFPQIAVRYSESIVEIYDFFDNDVNGQLSQAIDDFNGSLATTDAQVVADRGTEFQSILNGVSQSPFSAEASINQVLGIGARFEGGALFINARAVGDGVLTQSDADRQLLDDYIAAMELYAETDDLNLVSDTYPSLFNVAGQLDDQTDNLTSFARGTYVSILEYGMTFAKQVTLFGETLAVGVSPKYVEVTSYDFSALASDNTISDTQRQEHDGAVNLDIGFEKSFSPEWRGGLVIKNLISRDYETALNNTVKFSPQFRIGAAYQYKQGLIAADLDLKANDPVGAGDESQQLGIGINYQWTRLLNFQLGYQQNLKATGNHGKGLISGGLAFTSTRYLIQGSYADNNVEKALAFLMLVTF